MTIENDIRINKQLDELKIPKQSLYRSIVGRKLHLSEDLKSRECLGCDTKMNFITVSYEGEKVKLGWFCSFCHRIYLGKRVSDIYTINNRKLTEGQ